MNNITEELYIRKANLDEAKNLAAISKRAFESDVEVGASEPSGPPGYDNPKTHKKIMNSKYMDYFTLKIGNKLIGGMYISIGCKTHLILQGIFIEPDYFRKGLGTTAMEWAFANYPEAKIWTLGTPEWNIRTKAFYEKLGFVQIGWEAPQMRWYQKIMDTSLEKVTMPIAALEDKMKNVTVEGTITAKDPIREVTSRKSGRKLKVTNTELTDNSGSIILVLWNEQIAWVEPEDRIRVELGYTNSYQGTLQLNKGYFPVGHIIKLLKTA